MCLNPITILWCVHYPTRIPIQRSIKVGCMELCGGVHTAQRQRSTQIPIEVCVDLSVSVSVSVAVSVSVSGSGNAPLIHLAHNKTVVFTVN